jgi:hypothetical protein
MSEAEGLDMTRMVLSSRDLIRSLPVRSAFGLPVYGAASPSRSILDPEGFSGLEMTRSVELPAVVLKSPRLGGPAVC